jgi:hypothetical protein
LRGWRGWWWCRYSHDSCRSRESALYTVLSSECDGKFNCSVPLRSDVPYQLRDVQVEDFVDDDGTPLYAAIPGLDDMYTVTLDDILSPCNAAETQDVRLLVT